MGLDELKEFMSKKFNTKMESYIFDNYIIITPINNITKLSKIYDKEHNIKSIEVFYNSLHCNTLENSIILNKTEFDILFANKNMSSIIIEKSNELNLRRIINKLLIEG